MKHIVVAASLLLALAACHSASAPVAPAADPPASATMPPKDTVKTYPVTLLDSKKDPVCGMPSGAGIQDTIHLNGKVIGFCSKECEAAFLKDPKSYPVVYK